MSLRSTFRNLFTAALIMLPLLSLPMAQAQIGVAINIHIAPPALPVYEQPPLPAPGYLWTPGYWSYGDAGYFWVPGVWVQPPSAGLLWTPGYWGYEGGVYGWRAGYWGPHVGPSMVIGGCSGGALGLVLHQQWPWLVPHPASFAIVGMAGFFAAAAKTPFSTLIMVTEMTGGYDLLLPSLWVCTLSFILSDKQSIYASQVESRSLSPAHQGTFVRQVLAQVPRKRFPYTRSVYAGTAPPRFLGHGHRAAQRHPQSVLPVADGDNRLLGVVSLEEVYLASQAPSLQSLVLAEDLMRANVHPLTPNDTLDRALELSVENDLLTLPVVTNLQQRQMVGMVSRFDISSALRHVHGPAEARDG